MTDTQIIQMAADFCGDPDMTRFGSKYLSRLNRAQEQFALETKVLWKDVTWAHAANDADEDLPSDFMWEDFVNYDGKPLVPISRYRLTELRGEDWTADTANLPTHFLIDPEQAVKEIVLYPIPQQAATLSMRHFPLPASVSGNGDIILNSSSLMAQFHVSVAALTAWFTLMGEQSTPELSKKMSDLIKIYNDGATKAVDTFKNTASEPLRLRPAR